MERDFETNSSHYVPNRLSLWCPVCGASEGKGCKAVGGLRFESHDAIVFGTVPRPQVQVDFQAPPVRKGPPRNPPKFIQKRWVQ